MTDRIEGRDPEALLGLLAWLAVLEDRVRPRRAGEGEATVLVLDEDAANSFQVGHARETGPLVAYPRPFWWFADAWRGAAAGPAGLALLVAGSEPVAILLPSLWPRALAEWTARCRERGQCGLFPWAAAYEATLSQPTARRQPVSHVADLDRARGVSLRFVESEAWLDPWLQSPWLG